MVRAVTARASRRPAMLVGAGLVVLVLLVAAVFVVVRSAAAYPSAGGAARWDDFRRSDGPLAASGRDVLPSGQQWRIGYMPKQVGVGPQALRIQDGTLRFDSPGASYAWTVGETAPRTAAVDFVYEPGRSAVPSSSIGLIVSPKAGPEPVATDDGVASHSVHAGFGTEIWSIGIADGSRLRIIASGRYQLRDDGGTPYRASLRLVDPDTVQVDTPDGQTHTVTDSEISEYWGPSVLVEHYQPIKGFATDPRPVVTGYAVDSDRG